VFGFPLYDPDFGALAAKIEVLSLLALLVHKYKYCPA
jgi:hypothetical protein